ncbi:hypothetical protein ABZ468_25755 [Streptomyces sp. NPDC005708]|uniref:hypothetical protein n=1 Tax=Streptomyces sp. NPDC005708 TaxID=3154564 RepID=UPI00340A8016
MPDYLLLAAVWRCEDLVSLVHESASRTGYFSDCVEGVARHCVVALLLQDQEQCPNLVNQCTGKPHHWFRTGDFNVCDSSVDVVHGQLGCRLGFLRDQFVYDAVFTSVPPDLASCAFCSVAVIEERAESCPPFLTDTHSHVSRFLMDDLFVSCPCLNQGAAQSAQQSSSDAQSRRPYRSVPLIHAAHHAWTEGFDADA